MLKNLDKIKKIKGDLFSNTDIVYFDISYEKLLNTEIENVTFQNFPEFIELVYKTLTSGDTWEFNPTNGEIRKENELEIDRDALSSFINDNCDILVEPLSVTQNFGKISLSLEILVGNFRVLDDELVSKSDFYTVTTLFGDIDL